MCWIIVSDIVMQKKPFDYIFLIDEFEITLTDKIWYHFWTGKSKKLGNSSNQSEIMKSKSLLSNFYHSESETKQLECKNILSRDRVRGQLIYPHPDLSEDSLETILLILSCSTTSKPLSCETLTVKRKQRRSSWILIQLNYRFST